MLRWNSENARIAADTRKLLLRRGIYRKQQNYNNVRVFNGPDLWRTAIEKIKFKSIFLTETTVTKV